MTRTLTITATDPPLMLDEIVTLVRAGRWGAPSDADVLDGQPPFRSLPPVEFVAACAPCATCGGSRDSWSDYWSQDAEPCPDCRIELVGPCHLCRGSGKWVDCDFACNDCEGTAVMRLGGYAIGEPIQQDDGRWALKVQVAA